MDINYPQKRFSLCKLTETKEESLGEIKRSRLVSGCKTLLCRPDRLMHCSFEINYSLSYCEKQIGYGFKTPLGRPDRTHDF